MLPNYLAFEKTLLINYQSYIPVSEKQAVYHWITDNKKQDSDGNILEVMGLIYYYSHKNKLDPHLVLSLIKHESNFHPTVRSSGNALGYMQVIKYWHKEKVKGRDITDPNVNVEVGTSIIVEYLKSSNGDMSKALYKYSGLNQNYFPNIDKSKKDLKRYLLDYPKQKQSLISIPSLTQDYHLLIGQMTNLQDDAFIIFIEYVQNFINEVRKAIKHFKANFNKRGNL